MGIHKFYSLDTDMSMSKNKIGSSIKIYPFKIVGLGPSSEITVLPNSYLTRYNNF